MNKNVYCRCCGNQITRKNTVYGCRADDGGKLIRAHKFKFNSIDIDLYHCDICDHVQSDYLLEEDFYEQYADGAGFLQYYNGLGDRNKKIKKLYEYLIDKNKELSYLDIGCGAGYDMDNALKYFDVVEGVEPSEIECKIGALKGYTIYKGYFGEVSLNKKYDAITLFQVFEHMKDIKNILQNMYNVMLSNSIALINVPNGKYIRDHGAFHQIINEHINYFSPLSLATVCIKSGFSIIELITDDRAMEMDIYIKKEPTVKELNEVRLSLKNNINEIIKQYNDIGIYGAGAKTHIYINLIENKDKIFNIYDIDDKKRGLFVAGLDISIEKPENITNEAILILASSYTDNIIKYLVEVLNYCGDIYYIDTYHVLRKY